MDKFSELLLSLRRYVSDIKIGDIIEIVIIAYLLYHILLWIKKTRAWTLLKGLIVLGGFGAIAVLFRMHTILWMGKNILGYAVTALLVVMQPELRKALEELGKKGLLTSVLPFETRQRDAGAFAEKTINEIVRACVEMSKVRTGALIVMGRTQSLEDYERTGIEVDAIVSSQLLINIFEHNTPLHDGAVIVRGNRITSATCYLPLTDQENMSKEMGTRHRAGVGISEKVDCVTVIVSEQTGTISVAVDGQIERNLDKEHLRNKLVELIDLGGGEEKKQRIKLMKGKDKTKA